MCQGILDLLVAIAWLFTNAGHGRAKCRLTRVAFLFKEESRKKIPHIHMLCLLFLVLPRLMTQYSIALY